MSTRRVLFKTLIVLAVATARVASGSESSVVRLVGWASEGLVIPGNGHGPDQIALMVEAEWDRGASPDLARYQVRVSLPDGQAETRSFRRDSPMGRRRFPAYLPAASVRNRAPGRVNVEVAVVDSASGTVVSNVLRAGIEQFPRPRGAAPSVDPRPFGWGKPLDRATRILPGVGPDGLKFARISSQGGLPGFFLATTEATIRQVGERVGKYDPRAGRSDEFSLEGPDQPAVGLTPAKAMSYLEALGKADPSGVVYRLPTVEEWSRASRAGRASSFWWGDEPTHPEGANFLGPEPGQATDATAAGASGGFRYNPLGLFHTFGNVEEWATLPDGGFARMGGHFRTEPASPLPDVKVTGLEELGPDPFVGVRPAFDLSPQAGAALARKRLARDPRLAAVSVGYDPDRSTVVLTGKVPDPSSRRSADEILRGLWFVASVEDRLDSPSISPGQLAWLGSPSGPTRRVAGLRGVSLEIPLSVRWLDPLPVAGSEWWVNVDLPGGGHLSHRLPDRDVGRSRRVLAVVDLAQAVGPGGAVTVSISLGGPSTGPGSPNTVSNPVVVRLDAPIRSS